MGDPVQARLFTKVHQHHQVHDVMMARVVENGSVSDPFPVTNGVKQR